MSKNSFISWENAPISKEAFVALFIFISGLVGEGFYIYNRFLEIEKNMLEANTQIEELLSKHIENEEEEFAKLEERVKFYEKEFNINPLSWKKKKK
jgi:pilus assembly protein TadC